MEEINKKLPSKITDGLGPTAEDVIDSNDKENIVSRERIADIQHKRDNTVKGSAEEKKLTGEIVKEKHGTQMREQETETTRGRMQLKERIKDIFKKYGFTVTAVVTAVGVVIGVITSGLQSGLAKVAKGVGNGLKDLGKKLGQILPGMVGAIAGFIFKTAGEAIGFLAKNAWLLIVAVVVYFVEQLKNKKK